MFIKYNPTISWWYINGTCMGPSGMPTDYPISEPTNIPSTISTRIPSIGATSTLAPSSEPTSPSLGQSLVT